ncbi:hypothetical protein J6590_060723 [Homalodisca vitripennis]|nr:hypothetical protein J6590_060723 [Homalodisca vitripennis]
MEFERQLFMPPIACDSAQLCVLCCGCGTTACCRGTTACCRGTTACCHGTTKDTARIAPGPPVIVDNEVVYDRPGSMVLVAEAGYRATRDTVARRPTQQQHTARFWSLSVHQ